MNKPLIAILPFSCLLCPGVLPAQTDMGRVIPAERPIHVLAMGDYGSGSPHQSAVARAIARRHQELPFTLGVTMGDNFYLCGVHSTHDEKWKSRFEDLYGPLGIKIYAALGNHDYGHPPIICPANTGSPDAEVSYTERGGAWMMPARYYTFAAGPVRFFAIDTEGWSQKQFEWLKKVLADSQSEAGVKWRVVYGHHPMYTSGMHRDERRIGELRELLEPVLEKNHVDAFLAGHDHDMEDLRKNGVEYLICGTSGAELRKSGRAQPESIFRASTYGFLDFVIDQDRFAVRFYDAELHSLEDPELVMRRMRD